METCTVQEWWWPWDDLPRPLRQAATDLGYDRRAWQIEEFSHSGQRFLDMEELEFEKADRYGTMWRDDVSVCSDSDLIPGHDAWPWGCDSGLVDTMDLLPQPSRRSYCQGTFAAYWPRLGYSERNQGVELDPDEELDEEPDQYYRYPRTEWSDSLRAL